MQRKRQKKKSACELRKLLRYMRPFDHTYEARMQQTVLRQMLQEKRGRPSLLYTPPSERACLQRACAVRILRFRVYAGYETL